MMSISMLSRRLLPKWASMKTPSLKNEVASGAGEGFQQGECEYYFFDEDKIRGVIPGGYFFDKSILFFTKGVKNNSFVFL